MALRVVEHRQLLYIITMFLIVQFAGIALATQVFSGATLHAVSSVQTIGNSAEGAVLYIGWIVIFSVLLLVLLRVIKGDWLFTALELFIVVSASFIFFLLLITSLTGTAYAAIFGQGPSVYVLALSFAFGVILMAAKFKLPRLRNVTAIVASIGVGLALGISFGFLAALIFMIILAVYDFIAVFITKHMVTLGNMAVSRNMSLMVMASEIEAVPLSNLTKSERSEYKKAKPALAKEGGIMRMLVSRNVAPVAAMTALGTGDLAVPLMLSVAAYKVYFNFTLSLVVASGGFLGILLTMYILRKYKRPLPAIPFLLFGILVALGAFRLAMIL